MTSLPHRNRDQIARVTLDSMIQFVGLLDANGSVVEINKVALDAVGIAIADVEGKPFWTTFWWQVSEPIRAELREMIARAAKGELVRWDTEIYGRAGGKETIIIDASLCPVRDESGKVVFICAEGRDITEKKAQEREIAAKNIELHGLREQAETANRSKDEFLAMLGHELRNPLSPILTALQLMGARDDAQATERERTVIERQVSHLTRLVDDLLDVSRIARGKVELKTEIVEMVDVVAKAFEMASPLLEQRRQTLTVDCPAGLKVDGDPMRLRQVVSNLLTNAAKYTPPGGTISVRAETAAGIVALSVRDTGIGIAPAVLPRVFDLFVQERQALDRAHGGLGIGLAIVKNLVERHGGSVSVTSDGVGHGSEFVIRLPLATREVISARNTPLPIPQRITPDPASKPVRALIVDDNEDGAEMLAEALMGKGYETRVAHDAVEALAIARDWAPDIAFLDIGLPVMDGYELAGHLRAIPNLSELRLVAVTGYGQASDRAKSQEAGFNHHLVKPVDVAAIEATLALLQRPPLIRSTPGA